MPSAATLSQLATAAGYGPDDPLVIAIGRPGRRPVHLSRGCFPSGTSGVIACATDPGRGGPTTTTRVYAASLAKQIVAACTALLVQDGSLDVEALVTGWLPSLPPEVRVRHLIHHTSGLPSDVPPGGRLAEDGGGPAVGGFAADGGPGLHGDRTTAGVLAAADRLSAPAGMQQIYSNVGYVVLAEVVARVAGEDLPSFARRRIFEPLGMRDTLFWTGPGPAPPGAAPLGPAHPAPLSIGDGGMWSTAVDLLRWAAALDADELGITALVQTPGRLDDGTVLDYAWGMGVRDVGGSAGYQHGGSFSDVRLALVRVPEKGFDLVIVALADRTERSAVLRDRLVRLAS